MPIASMDLYKVSTLLNITNTLQYLMCKASLPLSDRPLAVCGTEQL